MGQSAAGVEAGTSQDIRCGFGTDLHTIRQTDSRRFGENHSITASDFRQNRSTSTVDLTAAVKRAETATQIQPQQLDIMRQYYGPGPLEARSTLASRIALPHASGMIFVETNKIVYCEADSNYTRFHLSGGEVYMVAKTLGDVQEVLEAGDFVRVHRQYIVNLTHIQKLVKGEGMYLLMSSGTSIPVSRQQKDRLMERFGWL